LPRLNSVDVDPMIPILVTGGAGYIGQSYLQGIAPWRFPSDYLRQSRARQSGIGQVGALEVGDLTDKARLREVFARYRPAAVVHFAALAR
jgi:UDP-glucose 4-epimerase